jgi:uncharacterized protein YndB with AHSA1/START domain
MLHHDVTTYIDAVERRVWSEERDGEPVRVAEAVRWYPTTLEDLWEAVTDAERIPRWFLPIEGDLRLGGRYQLQGNAGGTITECEPPRHFAVTWEFGGATSWLAVDLEGAGDRARLRLRHAARVDDDTMTLYGPGAVGIGWDLSLVGLALHLESGAAVDPSAFEAWSTSPDGFAFATGSGDGWCRAAIADGTPADEAEAAAARTLAFYTTPADAPSDAPPDPPSTEPAP